MHSNNAKVFDVKVSNGAFWIRYAVVAESEQAARALAESEEGANDPRLLFEEVVNASAIGQEGGMRYSVYDIEESAVWEAEESKRAITMLDSGAEG